MVSKNFVWNFHLHFSTGLGICASLLSVQSCSVCFSSRLVAVHILAGMERIGGVNRQGIFLTAQSCKNLQHCSAAFLVQFVESLANSGPISRCYIFCNLAWADDAPTLPILHGHLPNGFQVDFKKLICISTKRFFFYWKQTNSFNKFWPAIRIWTSGRLAMPFTKNYYSKNGMYLEKNKQFCLARHQKNNNLIDYSNSDCPDSSKPMNQGFG